MDAATFANTISDHVEFDWEHVADITRPGVAAKVAAVRAGTATTSTLDARNAARVIGELDGDEIAAALKGETRKTVLAASDGNAATKLKRSPTAALFDGPGEEVHTAILARKTVTPAMVDAYLAAPRVIRDITADHLVKIADPAALPAIIAERCDRYNEANIVAWYRNITDDLAGRANGQRMIGAPLIPDRHAATRQIQRLTPAVADALRSWFAQHGSATDKVTTYHSNVDTVVTVTEAAGTKLAALACAAGVAFAGPRKFGLVALAADSGQWRARSAAASAVTWTELRPVVVAGKTTERETLAAICALICEALDDTPRTNTLIAETIAAEFGGDYTGVTMVNPKCQTHAAEIFELVDPASALRFCAVTGDIAVSSWYTPGAYDALSSILANLDTTEAAELLAADPIASAHVQQVFTRTLAAGTQLPSRMWRHVLTHTYTSNLASLTAEHPEVAAALAGELSTLINETAGDNIDRRAALWQATCAIAPTLAAPAADAVHIADATLS